ncbi:MAG TPA: DUF4118 domain-containing protein [Rhodanobacteraceae bacterium]|nr:DUF4118 domain-containing protein [Rhodanobacteraceae bacterium]
MSATRPDPDRLLAEVKAGQQRDARGKLKIFFGACPGVGKTYAMLQSLQQLRAEGRSILVGVAETHGRGDTARLLEGLLCLPSRHVEYRGRTLEEFDLDAALAARPALIAVDELAHSNVEGSRHRKRWQDVEELLDAGIDVCTTLNVQHLESLNDVVGRITGIRVAETVPDPVFDNADDVVVVDLPADELLKRLADGKVYLPDAAARARENFFRKGNLIALRELALRRAADRVDAQMRDYRRTRSIDAVWAARERMLVGIAGTPDDERLVRHAARLAQKLEADWIAVHVDVAQWRRHGKQARRRIADTLALVHSLGAETATIPGTDAAEALLVFARQHNANRLVLGLRANAPWRFWQASMTDRIGRLHSDLDLVVVALDDARKAEAPRERVPRQVRWMPYVWTTLACLAATLVASPLLRVFDLANVVMLFLLTVVLMALRFGRGPGAWAALLAVACFDFFFVPPRYSMSVGDTQYLFTFVLMLGVALAIGQLTARLRHEARVAASRERRAIVLARLARELSGALMVEQIVEIALRDFTGFFQARVGLALPDEGDHVHALAHNACAVDESIAQWVYDHDQQAGAGTATLAAAPGRYLPLKAPMRVRGVLVMEFNEPDLLREPEEQRLLEACCSQLALALERVHFVEVAQRTLVQIEGERMRNTLLAAVSHDLRTPLTTILGAADAATLQLRGHVAEPLVASIREQAGSMLRLIENLLDMARLQAHGVELNRQWQSLEEIVGSALRELREPLRAHPVRTDLPADLPLIEVDGLLIERVLVNLLENAGKHTPPGTPIAIRARASAQDVAVEVDDEGPGLPGIDPAKLFDPFERGRRESSVPGIGLGLALARRIIEVHGGRIEARPNAPRGTCFAITLPLRTPPTVEMP